MRRNLTLATTVAIAVLAAATVAAQIAPPTHLTNGQPVGGNRYVGSDRTATAAALEPPAESTSEAWGRVLYFTHEYPSGIMSELQCHVFELAPQSSYELWIDGLSIGTLDTDATGEGWLRLQGREGEEGNSGDRRYPPIPEGLAAPFDVTRVWVAEADGGTTVLAGDFVDLPMPPVGTPQPVYLERIRLTPMAEDPPARGIARVARDEDDVQYLRVVGARLEPGAVYRIEIDGSLAGTATANPCGQFDLELSDAPGADPAIPGDLPAIENMRLVEVLAEDGDLLVLEGSFTGVNDLGLDSPAGGGHGWGHGGSGGGGGAN